MNVCFALQFKSCTGDQNMVKEISDTSHMSAALHSSVEQCKMYVPYFYVAQDHF